MRLDRHGVPSVLRATRPDILPVRCVLRKVEGVRRSAMQATGFQFCDTPSIEPVVQVEVVMGGAQTSRTMAIEEMSVPIFYQVDNTMQDVGKVPQAKLYPIEGRATIPPV